MYEVRVSQRDADGVENVTHFGFNKFSDAINFVEICVECGDAGTEVSIKETEEE